MWIFEPGTNARERERERNERSGGEIVKVDLNQPMEETLKVSGFVAFSCTDSVFVQFVRPDKSDLQGKESGAAMINGEIGARILDCKD